MLPPTLPQSLTPQPMSSAHHHQNHTNNNGISLSANQNWLPEKYLKSEPLETGSPPVEKRARLDAPDWRTQTQSII